MKKVYIEPFLRVVKIGLADGVLDGTGPNTSNIYAKEGNEDQTGGNGDGFVKEETDYTPTGSKSIWDEQW